MEGFPPGYEWDETKNQANIRKHRIDFRDAVRVFNKPTLDIMDDRHDYGEVRTNSIGDLGGLAIVLVTHTDRDGTTRLISARPSSSAERRAYLAFERELAGGQSPRLNDRYAATGFHPSCRIGGDGRLAAA